MTHVILAHELTVFHKASCDVTECLAFSALKCPDKCSVGLRSGTVLGLHCTSLQVDDIGGVFGLLVHLQYESFTTRIQPDSGACL